MVNENYPGDCLHFHRILDAAQPVYAVPGRPLLGIGEHDPVSEARDSEQKCSNLSPQIKPVKRKSAKVDETQRRYLLSRLSKFNVDIGVETIMVVFVKHHCRPLVLVPSKRFLRYPSLQVLATSRMSQGLLATRMIF